jgi:hypothetical protein
VKSIDKGSSSDITVMALAPDVKFRLASEAQLAIEKITIEQLSTEMRDALLRSSEHHDVDEEKVWQLATASNIEA